MSMAAPNLVLATGAQPVEITASFSLLTTQTAGAIVAGSISAFGPFVPPSSAPNIPITEVWHLVDIYTVGGPVGPDANTVFFLNGYIQNFNPKLSSLNLNLLTRFTLPATIPLAPGSTMAVSIVLLAAPTANATQLLTFKVNKSPFGA